MFLYIFFTLSAYLPPSTYTYQPLTMYHYVKYLWVAHSIPPTISTYLLLPIYHSEHENMWICVSVSVTKGANVKVLCDKVSIKSSPKAWWIFRLKWKETLFMLNYSSYYFGQLLEKFGLLFNIASGHSGLCSLYPCLWFFYFFSFSLTFAFFAISLSLSFCF